MQTTATPMNATDQLTALHTLQLVIDLFETTPNIQYTGRQIAELIRAVRVECFSPELIEVAHAINAAVLSVENNISHA